MKFKKGQKLSFGDKIASIMNKEGSKGRDIFFKPELGETVLRILPYMHDETGWPFVDTYTHWKINGENLLSPKTYQKKDPFIDLASEIWNNKNIVKEDKLKMFKRLMPQESTYVPIIVRGGNETEVKLWRIAKSIKELLFAALNDIETETLFDPYEGIDVILTKTQTDIADYRTIGYLMRLKRSNTPVGTDEQMEKIFNAETFPKYEDIFVPVDEKEYQLKFDNFIAGNKTLFDPTKKVEVVKKSKSIVNESVEKPEDAKSVETNANINDTLDKFKSMVNK